MLKPRRNGVGLDDQLAVTRRIGEKNMATMNIGEDDFATLADAANDAARRGDSEAAKALDKLARKANAALTNAAGAKRRFAGGPSVGGIKWTQVPSCLI